VHNFGETSVSLILEAFKKSGGVGYRHFNGHRQDSRLRRYAATSAIEARVSSAPHSNLKDHLDAFFP